ncbi:MAG: TIGR00153 family protein [Gammaproteobacteria bacterium]|nr:TIGR00153 family protein [Gammaproteobacteria bacterium]NIM73011.1 TIGR00153 family protein [Gammaproteobacteria bacterium]NIN38627.1 TIGR00153 family protein [Gammaproteobacteria bacterium]NIO24763.1 TIGR00153 family protein [Gammaproteobacteria bacterium]NIO65366.1 TIGR00153 family protein [Gammaproteobacteria bacterium]
MPSFNPIANLFGASPVRPLQKHMAKVVECASQLEPLFDAVVRADAPGVNKVQERIVVLEHEADDLKHDLRLRLPRSLFLPVERRDLLEVLTMQDNIANRAKDIAGLIRGRQMSFPADLGPKLKEFVKRCIDACLQAQKAVNELDELVETGFRGAEVELVQELITELNRIETDTDKIQVDVRAKVFAIERELPPIDVMFLYRIIDWTGDIGDRAQRVGSRLQLMLAR